MGSRWGHFWVLFLCPIFRLIFRASRCFFSFGRPLDCIAFYRLRCTFPYSKFSRKSSKILMKKTLKIDEKTSQKWYKNEEEVKIAFSFSKNRLFSSKSRFSVDFGEFTRPPGVPQEAQNRPRKKRQKKTARPNFRRSCS